MNVPLIFSDEKFRDLQNHEDLGKDLHDSIWSDCDFSNCELSGVFIVGAKFTNCNFTSVSFYWCHAFQATFVKCNFENCDLRGSFDEARFFRCHLVDCEVGDNNLGGKTVWEDVEVIDSVVTGKALPIIRSQP